MATYGIHKPMGWLWHVKKWLGFKVRPRLVLPFPKTMSLLWRAKCQRQANLHSILDNIETDDSGNLLVGIPWSKEGE